MVRGQLGLQSINCSLVQEDFRNKISKAEAPPFTEVFLTFTSGDIRKIGKH